MKILTPAYGRDYKNKASLLIDFHDNKDFVLNDITSPWDGKCINKEQLAPGEQVQFRYNHLRKTLVTANGA